MELPQRQPPSENSAHGGAGAAIPTNSFPEALHLLQEDGGRGAEEVPALSSRATLSKSQVPAGPRGLLGARGGREVDLEGGVVS